MIQSCSLLSRTLFQFILLVVVCHVIEDGFASTLIRFGWTELAIESEQTEEDRTTATKMVSAYVANLEAFCNGNTNSSLFFPLVANLYYMLLYVTMQLCERRVFFFFASYNVTAMTRYVHLIGKWKRRTYLHMMRSEKGNQQNRNIDKRRCV